MKRAHQNVVLQYKKQQNYTVIFGGTPVPQTKKQKYWYPPRDLSLCGSNIPPKRPDKQGSYTETKQARVMKQLYPGTGCNYFQINLSCYELCGFWTIGLVQ
jgi:hypothetical protein